MLTNADDEPFDIEQDPQEMEAYVIQLPKEALFSLYKMDIYDPDGVHCPYSTPLKSITDWRNIIDDIKSVD